MRQDLDIVNDHLLRKKFIDREDIRKELDDAFCQYKSDKSKKNIYILTGMSGIGKTRLVSEIYKDYLSNTSEKNLKLIKIHMEILGEETAITILQKIRENVKSAPLFDYAFLKYWEVSKASVIHTSCLRTIKDSLPFEVALGLLPLVDIAIPFLGTGVGVGLGVGTAVISKFIAKCDSYYSKQYAKNNLSRVKRDIDEAFRENPIKILDYLPQLLSVDIENTAKDKKILCIFDAYDKADKFLLNKQEWLKSLIKSFSAGFFIITSREPLEWRRSELSGTVKTLSVNEIPTRHIYESLRKVGFPRDDIDKIIEKTQCIPIYLDLALSIYERDGVDGLYGLNNDEKENFARKAIDHFSEDRQEVFRILSVIRYADEAIYESMLKQNGISALINPSTEIIGSTMISCVEKYRNFFKLHDVVASDISFFLNIEYKLKATLQFIRAIETSLYMRSLEENYTLICHSFKLCNDLFRPADNRYPYTTVGDSVVLLCFYLIENGYCENFYEFLKPLSIPACSPIYAAFCFLKACHYRNINIQKGIDILKSLDLENTWLDKEKKLFVCELNYLNSIFGNYIKAEEDFSEFYNSLSSQEEKHIYYTKGSLYNADMYMMRGCFIDSLNMLENILDVQIQRESFTFFEIHKAIGHCYRFNWNLEKALEHYESFHGHPGESLRMEAYKLTAIQETLCFSEHKKVLAMYEEALQKNIKLKNYNNVGKIYCSVCIAFAQDSNYTYAKKMLNNAYKTFEETGYSAGILFAQIADFFLTYSANKVVDLLFVEKIKRQNKQLGDIYHFLLLPIYLLTDDEGKISGLNESVQWLNYQETVNSINRFIQRLE